MSLNRLGIVLLGVVAACGGSSKKSSTPAGGGGAGAGPSAGGFAAQADLGGKLYGANCAKCHGDGGEGTAKGPAVVGKDALPMAAPDTEWGKKRAVTFKTAGDVFKFTKQAMPGDDPAALKDDEYLAILAFDLKANGVSADKALDAAALDAIVLHK